MHELRWNPLLLEWVAVTTARQDRPQMPANWCPFDQGPDAYPTTTTSISIPTIFQHSRRSSLRFNRSPGCLLQLEHAAPAT